MSQHVALNNVEHADLRVRTERTAELGDAVMSAPIFPHEFRNAQAHYPIVFAKDPATGGFRPVALFSLEEGSNLFLKGGGWDAPYIPLAMRMPPFLIGRGQSDLSVHIDLDHPRVNKSEGEALFLGQGEQSDFLKETAAMLGEIHEAEQALPQFTGLLDELGLIEPFTLDVTLKDGSEGRLAGLFVIAEEALGALNDEQVLRLHNAQALPLIYMVIASLSQFGPLIERRNKQIDEHG